MSDTPVAAAGSGLPFEPHTFRLPLGTKARLKARAVATRRTLNAEVIVILERALAEFEEPAETRPASHSVTAFTRD